MKYDPAYFDEEFFACHTGEIAENGRVYGVKGNRRIDPNHGMAFGVATTIDRFFHGLRIANIGDGVGVMTRMLQDLGNDVEGCDVSRFAVDWAIREGGCRGYRVDDARRLDSFVSDGFDLAVCWNVLGYLEEPDVPKALAAIRRVAPRALLSVLTAELLKKNPRSLVGRRTIRPRIWWAERMREAGFQKDWDAQREFNQVGGFEAFLLRRTE